MSHWKNLRCPTESNTSTRIVVEIINERVKKFHDVPVVFKEMQLGTIFGA